jgi:hypothetical protein
MNQDFTASFIGNPNGYLGIAPCGDADAWLNGVSLFEPPPPCNCGREAVVPVQEVPAGLVDGLNRTFTLSELPVSAVSVVIFVNGVFQHQGVNYSVSAQTVFFTLPSTPRAGGDVVAYYWRLT